MINEYTDADERCYLENQERYKRRQRNQRDRWWDQSNSPDGGTPEPEPEEQEDGE